MLKIFINLYCKVNWRTKAIGTTCESLVSSIQGQILKIDVTKSRLFCRDIIGKGYFK